MQRGSASLSYLVLFPRNIRLLPRAIFRHFKGFHIGLRDEVQNRGKRVWLAKCCKIQPKLFLFKKIFVQLRPELFSCNNNNSSTSTMHCRLITNLFYDNGFESFRTFRISSFTNYPFDP